MPDRSPLPVQELMDDNLRFSFSRLTDNDVAYLIDGSPDLDEWSLLAELPAGASSWTGPAAGSVVETSDGDRIDITFTDPEPVKARRFLRLRVER